ncbi:MAG: hypothetical protein ABIJ27_03540 [Candidatus Omnitrophota bacterium]
MIKATKSLKIISRDSSLHEQIGSVYFPQKNKPSSHSKQFSKRNLYFFAIGLPFSLLLAAGAVTYKGGHFDRYLRRDAVNPDELRSYVRIADSLDITAGGRTNSRLIKKLFFGGYAREKSARQLHYITIKNEKKYLWGDLTVEFKCPLDISTKIIHLSVKGQRGGEKAALVLKDSRDRSFKLRDMYLPAKWVDIAVPVRSADHAINTTRIASIRIESDFEGEPIREKDSDIENCLHIKNISLKNSPSQ